MAVALVLVVVAASVLAWTAVSADRAQRATATGTVRDYADFAAFLLARDAEARMRQALFYTFYREELAWQRGGAALEPGALLEDPQESDRCAAAYAHGDRWAARLDLPDGALAAHGPIGAAGRTRLSDTLAALAVAPGSEPGHLVGLPGLPIVAFRLRRPHPDSTAMHAYALSSCFRDRDGSVFEAAPADGPLLPPTLVGNVPPDSLVSIVVRDADGVERFRTTHRYESEFVGHAAPSRPGTFGGSTISATLRPGVADRLLRGRAGLYSRAPLALGLLAATVALVGVAALLMWRGARLVRLRERFVADVSHELRTPLQQVLMFVQLLRIGQARSPEERDRFLSIIEREAVRLTALVERVLAFAGRPRAPVAGNGVRRADVARVARDAIASFEPIATERSQRVVLDAPESARAEATSDGVHQIVLNLLDNAAKYGPPGQSIHVRVTAGPHPTLEVRDAGPGIPTRERERVWAPFYRLDREEVAARSGSGIGLAVVRGIAERHGAATEVEDAPGGGSIFRVRFRGAPR